MRLPNSNVERPVVSPRPEPIKPEVPQLLELSQVLEKFTFLLSELDHQISECSESSLESLGQAHQIKSQVQQIFWLISQASNPDESCLLFAEKIVGALYKNCCALALEVYILILRRFFDISKTLPRELKDWFLYSEDKVY